MSQVNVLIIEGMSTFDFVENQSELEEWSKIFPHKLEMISAESYDSNVVSEISVFPLPNRTKRRLNLSYKNNTHLVQEGQAVRIHKSVFPILKSLPDAKPNEDETCLKLRFLLNARQMISEGYPMPLPSLMKGGSYDDFIMTKDQYNEVNEESALYSIDCEMCLTSVGQSELTRVCVVDADLKVTKLRIIYICYL